MPVDGRAVAGQNETLLGCEKPFVLLKRAVNAVPGVGAPAVAVGDAIEAVENTAMMWRMNFGIVIQATGDDPISVGREYVMENFISANATRRRGLVKPFVVVRHNLSLAQQEIGVMAGLIVPGEASRGCRLSRECGL